jgi:hypothetical protein
VAGSPTPAGIVVVRVWLEDARPDGFRARVTTSSFDAPRNWSSTAVASLDEAIEAVRRFLDEFTLGVTRR